MAEKFGEKIPEVKSKAETRQEWRERFGPLAEMQLGQEKMERKEARARTKEWKEFFGPLSEMWTPSMRRELAKEKKAVESAKIPEKGIEPGEILKEVGVPDTPEQLQGETAEIKQKQQKREASLGSFQDVKIVGEKRLKKAAEALSYAAVPDKLALLGLKEGKKLAIRGGRWLAAIGLAPIAAAEEINREIVGRLESRRGNAGKVSAEAGIKSLEEIPRDKRPAFYQSTLGELKEDFRRESELLQKGMEKLYKKGKLCELVWRLWG